MKLLFKILLPIIIIGAGIAGFLQLKASKPAPVAIEAPEKQWSVNITAVHTASHTPLASLYGRIESPNRSALSAALSADVVQVHVKEGELVEAGQILVELDRRDLELRLKQRQAELAEVDARITSESNAHKANLAALEDELALEALARRNLARAQKLARTKAGSEAGVDEALQVIRTRSLAVIQRRRSIDDHAPRLAQLEASRARITALRTQAETDLQRTSIRAPFRGRITLVNASIGERLRVGDPLVEIYDVGELEIRAQIPERYVTEVRGSLQDQDPVKAVLKIRDSVYNLVLDRFAGSIRQGQGGIDGFFRFAGSDAPALEVGRVVPLEVSLPAVPDAISLPIAALYGSNTVYRVVAGRLENVNVVYAGEHRNAEGEDRVLVTSSALKSGDQVITTQVPAAVEGLKVSANGK